MQIQVFFQPHHEQGVDERYNVKKFYLKAKKVSESAPNGTATKHNGGAAGPAYGGKGLN